MERVKELLKEVNTNATKALNLLDSSGKEEQRIDDLVITTQVKTSLNHKHGPAVYSVTGMK